MEITPEPGSAAWTAEAIVVFTIGWFRDSSYLRWLGIGTLGLTILKFLLVDLARVDARLDVEREQALLA